MVSVAPYSPIHRSYHQQAIPPASTEPNDPLLRKFIYKVWKARAEHRKIELDEIAKDLDIPAPAAVDISKRALEWIRPARSNLVDDPTGWGPLEIDSLLKSAQKTTDKAWLVNRMMATYYKNPEAPLVCCKSYKECVKKITELKEGRGERIETCLAVDPHFFEKNHHALFQSLIHEVWACRFKKIKQNVSKIALSFTQDQQMAEHLLKEASPWIRRGEGCRALTSDVWSDREVFYLKKALTKKAPPSFPEILLSRPQNVYSKKLQDIRDYVLKNYYKCAGVTPIRAKPLGDFKNKISEINIEKQALQAPVPKDLSKSFQPWSPFPLPKSLPPTFTPSYNALKRPLPPLEYPLPKRPHASFPYHQQNKDTAPSDSDKLLRAFVGEVWRARSNKKKVKLDEIAHTLGLSDQAARDLSKRAEEWIQPSRKSRVDNPVPWSQLEVDCLLKSEQQKLKNQTLASRMMIIYYQTAGAPFVPCRSRQECLLKIAELKDTERRAEELALEISQCEPYWVDSLPLSPLFGALEET